MCRRGRALPQAEPRCHERGSETNESSGDVGFQKTQEAYVPLRGTAASFLRSNWVS